MKKYKIQLKENQEIIDFFFDRTNKHITYVQQFGQLLSQKNFIKDIVHFNYNIKYHDDSKFNEPEFTPYIQITWNYHLKDLGKEVKLTDEEKDFQNAATNHHITTNEHHPEYWDKTFSSVPRNDRDSVTVEKATNAIYMPDYAIAEMVCDWLAMSKEKGTSTYEWAEKNIGKRWIFTPSQIDLIYKIINCFY